MCVDSKSSLGSKQCNSIKDKGKQSITYSGLRFYNNEMESYVDIFLFSSNVASVSGYVRMTLPHVVK